MEKIKILVVAHKASSFTQTAPPMLPIQVGAALHPELDLGFVKDNTGDNISEKNGAFNELTALYWGWKNIHDVEYLGLNHYRRYFGMDINSSNVDQIMKGYDIMVCAVNPYGTHFGQNKNSTIYATSQEDFWIFLDTLCGFYPDRKKEITDFFFNYQLFIPFNMFLAKKELYDEYCAFLFPLLFKTEERLKPHGYSRQNRAIGYIGEACLGLFIYLKGLKVNFAPWIMCEENSHTNPYTVKKGLKALFPMLRHTIRKHTRHTIKDIVVPDDVRAGLLHDGITLSNI